MAIKIDISDVENLFADMKDLPDDVMKKAYPELKKNTPVRSGNARRRTKLKGNEIRSDYGYAGRLDDGWSRQAPKGFTEPTIKKLPVILDRLVRKLNG